jgi:hypothetical protein
MRLSDPDGILETVLQNRAGATYLFGGTLARPAFVLAFRARGRKEHDRVRTAA